MSRSSGQSAVASAAYRSGQVLEDQTIAKTFDYQNKQGIEVTKILVPQNQETPEWVFDRETLWNEVEKSEKRKNSTVAREVLVALPHELSKDQREELTAEFSQWLANKYQVIVDMAVHEPSKEGDDRNYHAHIMMTPRQIEEDGFSKVKSYKNDKGQSVRLIPLDYGGQRGSDEITAIREQWADNTNDFLSRAGATDTVDHRTLEAQGIDRAASFHLGHEVTAMERKGIATLVGDRLRTVLHINEAIDIAKQAAERVKDIPNKIYQRYQKYTRAIEQTEQSNTIDREIEDGGYKLE